jgi:hypothetical protein
LDRNVRNGFLLFLLVVGFSLLAVGQGNDLAVVVGAKVTPGGASSPFGTATVNTALGFEGSVAIQLTPLPFASLQVELPVMFTPNTTVNSSNFFSPKSYSSVYITPGIRLKFKPTSSFNPWVAVGGGLVRFNPSSTSVAGGSTSATGALKGSIDAGAGLDFKAPYIPFLIRVQAREYFSGSPNLNIASLSLHNNLFAGIGLVVRF